jgi:hypothetical protein
MSVIFLGALALPLVAFIAQRTIVPAVQPGVMGIAPRRGALEG